MKKLCVKKLRTTGYNPRANGLTEKRNEIIKNYMTFYSESNKQEWDLWCNEAVYTYNSSIHSSIGYTPARLFFGGEYRIPLDIMFSTRGNNEQPSTILEYEDNLKHIYEIARENNMQTRECMTATYYEWRIKANVLKKGGLIFVLLPEYVKQRLTFNGKVLMKLVTSCVQN